ncbi:MAG: T9SS type A sorting domain-containing protein [Bacteroidota bacterium]
MKNHTQSVKQIFSKSFLLFLFLFVSSEIGFSQASLSTRTLIFPSTSYWMSTDTVKAWIKNVGNQSYTGPISINFTTNTVTITPVLLCTPVTLTLNPNDSIQLICPILFDSTNFQTGNNIVVVWSSGNAIAPADSVWTNVFLKTQPAGVHEPSLNSSLSVYPTLVKDFLFVELKTDAVDNTLFPEAIRVTDVFGRRIYKIETVRNGKNKIQINTSALSSGFYLLEISLPENRKMTAKFIRQ